MPGGRFPLRQVLYRPDRTAPPATRLPVQELDPGLVWCDDPTCADYNQLVSLPHAGGYEALWRDDNVYDLLAVVGYNDDPVVPGAGSAIFVHIARPGLTPTTGCVGVAIDDLLELLEYINPGAPVTAVSNPRVTYELVPIGRGRRMCRSRVDPSARTKRSLLPASLWYPRT